MVAVPGPRTMAKDTILVALDFAPLGFARGPRPLNSNVASAPLGRRPWWLSGGSTALTNRGSAALTNPRGPASRTTPGPRAKPKGTLSPLNYVNPPRVPPNILNLAYDDI